MRAFTRTIKPLSQRVQQRSLSTTSRALVGFSTGPAPPRLPKEEQEIFEKLQRQSTGAFSTPRPSEGSPESDAEKAADSDANAQTSSKEDMLAQMRARIKAKGDGEELHPNIRRGAPPEFEGNTNPKTGEVGGPKNDPLRWGSSENRGDWSFNGRVTDF